jgi:hypothetical protein
MDRTIGKKREIHYRKITVFKNKILKIWIKLTLQKFYLLS